MFRPRSSPRPLLMFASMIASAIAIDVSMPAAASAQFVGSQTTRVSVAADGTQANGDSGPAAAITSDGRYVAFASSASNLVTGDTNGSIDVFVKDRQTGAIVRVSVGSDGTERVGDSGVEGVDLTDDGNIIVFTSRAAFVVDDTHACTVPAASGAGPSCPDIYLHNRTSGQTVRISAASGGGNANGASRQPGISGVTGRFVSFASDATNLVAERHQRHHRRVPARSRHVGDEPRQRVDRGRPGECGQLQSGDQRQRRDHRVPVRCDPRDTGRRCGSGAVSGDGALHARLHPRACDRRDSDGACAGGPHRQRLAGAWRR